MHSVGSNLPVKNALIIAVRYATSFNLGKYWSKAISCVKTTSQPVSSSGRRDFSRWKSAGTRNHRRNRQFHRAELKQSREMIDLPSRCRYVRSRERKKRKRKRSGGEGWEKNRVNRSRCSASNGGQFDRFEERARTGAVNFTVSSAHRCDIGRKLAAVFTIFFPDISTTKR